MKGFIQGEQIGFGEVLRGLIEERSRARFLARAWVPKKLYDCVTFVADVYEAIGLIGHVEMPKDYAVFGKGDSMLKLIYQVVDSTEGFDIMPEALEEDFLLKDGDLVVLSEGERGHHCGIFLEGERGKELAHCARRRGVEVLSWLPPLSDHVVRVYRPKSELLNAL